MTTVGLDCWDDYPMEHGCICGNDCPPPPLPFDTLPWVWYSPSGAFSGRSGGPYRQHEGDSPGWSSRLEPRPGYSQNEEDYA